MNLFWVKAAIKAVGNNRRWIYNNSEVEMVQHPYQSSTQLYQTQPSIQSVSVLRWLLANTIFYSHKSIIKVTFAFAFSFIWATKVICNKPHMCSYWDGSWRQLLMFPFHIIATQAMTEFLEKTEWSWRFKGKNKPILAQVYSYKLSTVWEQWVRGM
jgi:hypothetical protein